MATVGACLICWRALREPKVCQGAAQGVALGKDLSKRGVDASQRLHGDLKERWRRRREDGSAR